MRCVRPSEVFEHTSPAGFSKTEQCPPGSFLPPALACLQASWNYRDFLPFCIVNPDAKCAWQGPKERHQHFCVLNINTHSLSVSHFLSCSCTHTRLYEQETGEMGTVRNLLCSSWLNTSFLYVPLMFPLWDASNRQYVSGWLDLLVPCRALEAM